MREKNGDKETKKKEEEYILGGQGCRESMEKDEDKEKIKGRKGEILEERT